MNWFLSNATNRIDAKGRVSVPSAFRLLAQRDIRELYCFQDFMFPAISVGGLDLLDRFERQIASEDVFSPIGCRSSFTGRGLHEARFGRAPGGYGFHPDFTGITTDVTFVGRADHFQLWAPQTFEATQAAAREEFRTRGLGSG